MSFSDSPLAFSAPVSSVFQRSELCGPSLRCRRSPRVAPKFARTGSRLLSIPYACADPTNLSAEERALKGAVKEVKSLLKKCPLYFVGCMGCGKSAVAKYCAFELGYRFLDTDELVELVAGGVPVSEIFAKEGEDAFRKLETAILDQVQAFTSTCVATGGGAVLRNENWARMQTGIVVWLDAPPRVLAERLDGDTSRPLLAGMNSVDEKEAKLSEILESRRVRYELADVTVPINGDQAVDDIACDLFRRVANFIKSNPPRFAAAQEALYPKDTPRPPAPEEGA